MALYIAVEDHSREQCPCSFILMQMLMYYYKNRFFQQVCFHREGEIALINFSIINAFIVLGVFLFIVWGMISFINRFRNSRRS
ncbi:hypothetical protein BaLi_c11600 [Bacillus paralicheniformis ATCC 9945a]|nr:hypothetical protein BaLi_c11600 [Bacillus paralicheniformis ATCC 9945a]